MQYVEHTVNLSDFFPLVGLVEKCTISKDLVPLQACSPRTQGEIVTVNFGEMLRTSLSNPSCLWEGLVELKL